MSISAQVTKWTSSRAEVDGRLSKLRWVLAAATLLSLVTLTVLINTAYGTGTVLGHYTRGRLVRMVPALLAGLSCATIWLASYRGQTHKILFGGMAILSGTMTRARWFSLLIYFCLPPLFIWMFWGFYNEKFMYVAPRLAMFGYFVLLGAILLRGSWPKITIGLSLAATVVFYTLIYQIALLIPQPFTYPLSLAWSESSRYYYASLFFSGQVYGDAAPLPFLHPSRYLLQSIPFLVSGLPIWFHRFWQVLLWVGMTGLTGVLLARRIPIPNRLARWSLVAWVSLFLFQGPVYYHLLVCVILLLWGFNKANFGRTLVFVLLASCWAGISRVNWYPVPGLLAGALYLLEEKASGKPIWRYLLPASIWVCAGLAAAFMTQGLYRYLSGNPPSVFDTSFNSALLWYRLLPTPTYGDGVLLTLAFSALPVFVVIIIKTWQTWTAWHPLRVAGLGSILAVLLGGGIVVSAKIGGGSNLHNLDAFIVVLAVIAAYLFWDYFGNENARSPVHNRWGWILAAVLLIQPVWFTVRQGGPFTPPDSQDARAAIASLQKHVDAAKQRPGEILFISQRHLLAFHQITGVPLIPEYEKVDLMEMAMANSQPYLQAFQHDLKNQRFSLIVVDELNVLYQDESHQFAEENNAWARNVARKINAYYRKADVLIDGIEVLTPRP